MEEVKAAIRCEQVVPMDETGGPIGNADGPNREGKRGWLWVVVTSTLAVFRLALGRSPAVAKALLGGVLIGFLISDHASAHSWLPLARGPDQPPGAAGPLNPDSPGL